MVPSLDNPYRSSSPPVTYSLSQENATRSLVKFLIQGLPAPNGLRLVRSRISVIWSSDRTLDNKVVSSAILLSAVYHRYERTGCGAAISVRSIFRADIRPASFTTEIGPFSTSLH